MINEQLARILQSKPESLITAIESNNQDLLNLETLLEERGKQVASLQFLLTNEVGLVDKILNARGKLINFQEKMAGVVIQLKELKMYVKEEVKRTHNELMTEIAKVFKDFYIEKKNREEEIESLKREIERLNYEIQSAAEQSSGSRGIMIDNIEEQLLGDQMRQCRLPMLETGGYTLGNQSLKELFSPMQHSLSLSDIKSLKEQSYERSVTRNLKQWKGEVVYQKGFSYRGTFRNGQRHGFGQLFLLSHVVYRGDWKKDVFWGKGTLQLKDMSTQFENATIYMGNFQNGQFHGLGVIQFEDGSRFTTEFNKGKVVSPGVLNKNEYMTIREYENSVSLDPICSK